MSPFPNLELIRWAFLFGNQPIRGSQHGHVTSVSLSTIEAHHHLFFFSFWTGAYQDVCSCLPSSSFKNVQFRACPASQHGPPPCTLLQVAWRGSKSDLADTILCWVSDTPWDEIWWNDSGDGITARLKRDNDGYQCPTVPHFITPAAIKPSLSEDDLCQLQHRVERNTSVRLLLGEQLDSWWHYSFYQLGLSQDAVENLLTFAGVTHAYKHGCADLVLEGLIQVSFSPWQKHFLPGRTQDPDWTRTDLDWINAPLRRKFCTQPSYQDAWDKGVLQRSVTRMIWI